MQHVSRETKNAYVYVIICMHRVLSFLRVALTKDAFPERELCLNRQGRKHWGYSSQNVKVYVNKARVPI